MDRLTNFRTYGRGLGDFLATLVVKENQYLNVPLGKDCPAFFCHLVVRCTIASVFLGGILKVYHFQVWLIIEADADLLWLLSVFSF